MRITPGILSKKVVIALKYMHNVAFLLEYLEWDSPGKTESCKHYNELYLEEMEGWGEFNQCVLNYT